MIVSKTFSICAGHRLMDYEGLCANAHGHNYEITVELASRGLDGRGFVVDYNDVKAIVKPVLEVFDHAFLVNSLDPFRSWLIVNGQRIVVFNANPTAEVIAQVLYNILQPKLEMPPFDGGLLRVKVAETEGTLAEAVARDNVYQVLEVYPCAIP